jgi:hypothetical protein
MKRGKILIGVLLLFFVLPAYAGAAGLGELRLSLIDGDVQMRTEDTDEWVPAGINMPLRAGDQLWVPEDSRTEIQARNGTVVRLDGNTSLDILAIENSSLQFYLMKGRAYLNFRNQEDSMIQLDTPVSSVRVYEPTKFITTVLDNGDTDISVLKGRVYAEGRSGKTQVGAGKILSLGDGYAEISPLGRADEWEKWNKERDSVVERRGKSSQYLPDELKAYASDFDNNGRWVYTGSYGYVWTPQMHISVGWAPYRHGRWTWVGSDYVWIAYEPWGWAPYHYGRWTFIGSFGWCWVPPSRGAVYWGPGYVGWVHTPTYVAWVPLAPREIYYGYGYYGPYSVNIVNINVNRIVVKEVYRNVHVHNSVTVVHNETFLRGKKVDVNVRENPFLKQRISVGRPQIKPEKVTRMPVLKDIPREKEPPRNVRDLRPNKIKQERALIKERDRSVFKPDASQRTMPVRRLTEPKTGGIQEQRIQPGSLEQSGREQTGPGKRRVIEQVPAGERDQIRPRGIERNQDRNEIRSPQTEREIRQERQRHESVTEQPDTLPEVKPEIRRAREKEQVPARERENQIAPRGTEGNQERKVIRAPQTEKELRQERQRHESVSEQPDTLPGVKPEIRRAREPEQVPAGERDQIRPRGVERNQDRKEIRSPQTEREIRQERQRRESVTEQSDTVPEVKPEIRRAREPEQVPAGERDQIRPRGTERNQDRNEIRSPQTEREIRQERQRGESVTEQPDTLPGVKPEIRRAREPEQVPAGERDQIRPRGTERNQDRNEIRSPQTEREIRQEQRRESVTEQPRTSPDLKPGNRSAAEEDKKKAGEREIELREEEELKQDLINSPGSVKRPQRSLIKPGMDFRTETGSKQKRGNS